MAQGTIRPWSDRIFFMRVLRALRPGRAAVPHLASSLTQMREHPAAALGGAADDRFADGGFRSGAALDREHVAADGAGWTSAYNEPLCALFILGAFHFLLRYLETGERRYWMLQWVVFPARLRRTGTERRLSGAGRRLYFALRQ